MRAITVGTDPSCDIVVKDPYASSRHCRIVEDDDGSYWVEDLGSMNGTWLRRPGASMFTGVRVYGRTRIPAGMRVWLGTRTELPWEPR